MLSLQGSGRPSQGLAHMQKGKEYYLYLLRSQVGSWTAVKDMQNRLTEQIQRRYEAGSANAERTAFSPSKNEKFSGSSGKQTCTDAWSSA